jgi:hypothetical protein
MHGGTSIVPSELGKVLDSPAEVSRTPLLLTVLRAIVSLVDRVGKTQWALGQMAAFMNDPRQKRKALVTHKSSFEYMQSNEDRFVPPMFSAGRKVMFRSGKSRFSGELIDAAQQDAIDRFALSELRRLGSDFPYAELYM